jgi:hypothetical protein
MAMSRILADGTLSGWPGVIYEGNMDSREFRMNSCNLVHLKVCN